MQIMAESKVGEKDVVGLTLICATDKPTESGKCLLAYIAAISMTAPGISVDTRGKIVNVLVNGLEAGNETSIKTDERKYILQKSVGLWFHVLAADGED